MWKVERRPGETKEEAESRSQEEALAEIERRRRERDAVERKLYTHWLFWTACPYKRCKRAQACSGDVKRCYDRFWPQVPEEMKVALRASISAQKQGLSGDNKARHVKAELARHFEIEARQAEWDAMRRRSAARRPEPEPPQPRVRLG